MKEVTVIKYEDSNGDLHDTRLDCIRVDIYEELTGNLYINTTSDIIDYAEQIIPLLQLYVQEKERAKNENRRPIQT